MVQVRSLILRGISGKWCKTRSYCTQWARELGCIRAGFHQSLAETCSPSAPSPSSLTCGWAEWSSVFLEEAHQHGDLDCNIMTYKKCIFGHSGDQNTFLMCIFCLCQSVSWLMMPQALDLSCDESDKGVFC